MIDGTFTLGPPIQIPRDRSTHRGHLYAHHPSSQSSSPCNWDGRMLSFQNCYSLPLVRNYSCRCPNTCAICFPSCCNNTDLRPSSNLCTRATYNSQLFCYLYPLDNFSSFAFAFVCLPNTTHCFSSSLFDNSNSRIACPCLSYILSSSGSASASHQKNTIHCFSNHLFGNNNRHSLSTPRY